MKKLMLFVRVSAVCAAVMLLWLPRQTYATNVLISGNSMGTYNTNLTDAISGLGLTAVFVAPSNFASTSLTGFDAVWLDGFSYYGSGNWPNKLLSFMNAGGNVFVQNPGFGSELLSFYPLGAQLAATFTYPPGEETITIIDAVSPLTANHSVNALLTGAGLSNWGASAYGYFPDIGSFVGLTDTGTPGQWVTIMTEVGDGYLVYTQQGVSQYLGSSANPGPTSDAGRFLDNVVTLSHSQVPEPATITLLLLGLGLFGFKSLKNKGNYRYPRRP